MNVLHGDCLMDERRVFVSESTCNFIDGIIYLDVFSEHGFPGEDEGRYNTGGLQTTRGTVFCY